VKIVKLQAENVKRLRAVEITPTGNVVQITGKNGQGKTSLLDAIWWALGGQAAIQGQPIRTGENRARIRLDLGEIVVTRKFKRHEDGEVATEIIVENAEGVRYGSPQRMLDALLGELTFDPLAFARMAPKEQFETLRRFVPGVDFDAIDAAQKTDYDIRTTLNRQAKEARAQAEGVAVPADTPATAVDEQALVAELAAAGEKNREADRIAAAWNRVSVLRDQAARLSNEADALAKTLPESIPQPIDVQALRQKVDAAHRLNAGVEARAKRAELLSKAEDLEEQSVLRTQQMEARERGKRAAIAAAAMPVSGLDFGEGVVLKDGVPFDQASDAEKLRASVAIAMAMNPKLRVVRIRDGSLLDAESLETVAQMADANDCQVWVERVSDDRKVGFVIEDGALAPSGEGVAS
jgi:DNA repair exonuclease SbcCD ATPase subunit